MRFTISFIMVCFLVITLGCNKSDCLSSASYVSGFFQEMNREVSSDGSVYTIKLEGNVDIDNAVLLECGVVQCGYLLLDQGQEVYRDTLWAIDVSERTISKEFVVNNLDNSSNLSLQLFISDCLDCDGAKGREYFYDTYSIKPIEKWPQISTPITSGLFDGISVTIPNIYGNDSVVLVGLGENGQGGLSKSFWIFDGENWISNAVPNLPVALKGAVASFYDGNIIIGFGETADGFNDKVFKYSIYGGDDWEQIGTSFPSFKNGVSFTIDDHVYFGLGVESNGDFNTKLYELSGQNDAYYWTGNDINIPGGDRINAVVYEQGNQAFIFGGSNNMGSPSNDLISIDASGFTQTVISDYPNNVVNPSGFAISDRYFFINSDEENTANFFEMTNSPTISELGNIDFAFRRKGAISFSLKGRGYYGLGVIEFDANTKQYLNDVYEFIPF